MVYISVYLVLQTQQQNFPKGRRELPMCWSSQDSLMEVHLLLHRPGVSNFNSLQPLCLLLPPYMFFLCVYFIVCVVWKLKENFFFFWAGFLYVSLAILELAPIYQAGLKLRVELKVCHHSPSLESVLFFPSTFKQVPGDCTQVARLSWSLPTKPYSLPRLGIFTFRNQCGNPIQQHC